MIPSIMLASFMAVIGAAGPDSSLPEAAMYRDMAAVRSLLTQKVSNGIRNLKGSAGHLELYLWKSSARTMRFIETASFELILAN